MAHTVYTQDLIEISLQANENLDVLLDLIRHKIQNEENLNTSYIFTLICELMWINSRILFVLRKELQDLTFVDQEQKEIMIPKPTLQVLSTMLVAKWQATQELNKFSYSLSLH